MISCLADRRRVGRESGRGDDDESTVTCPRGYLPINCAASNQRTSDGVVVSDRSCTAVNSAGGGGQRVRVMEVLSTAR